jgi:hypothetical protein
MAKEPPARDVRWRPILGLVLSLVFPVLQVIGFALYTASQHPTH